MKIHLVFIVLILLACTEKKDKDCMQQMITAITSDSITPPETFVVLDTKVDGKVQKLCMNNESLKWRIKKKFSISDEMYKQYLDNFINHTDTLELNKEDISNDYLVVIDKEMESLYKKGIDSLKREYFHENGVQKSDVVIENKNYLVSLLFSNCTISWIDDETGYMVIKDNH